MRYMLDTNILIFVIRKKSKKVLDRLSKHNPDDICISTITFAELMHGVEKSLKTEKNKAVLMQLLSCIEIIDFDCKAAQEYGAIRAKLELQGNPIGPLDTMIAGHARSLGYTLVTNNTKEFNRIENLKIEDWS